MLTSSASFSSLIYLPTDAVDQSVDSVWCTANRGASHGILDPNKQWVLLALEFKLPTPMLLLVVIIPSEP